MFHIPNSILDIVALGLATQEGKTPVLNSSKSGGVGFEIDCCVTCAWRTNRGW